MIDVLPFVILMKEIEFVLKIKGDALKVLYSLFKKPVTPVTVYRENQGAITLAVSPKLQLRTKRIAINYYHFRSFVVNVDAKVKHVDTKEQITDIFTKLLDSYLLGYLHYNLNGW